MFAAIVRSQVWANDDSTFFAQKRSRTTTSCRHHRDDRRVKAQTVRLKFETTAPPDAYFRQM